MISIQRHHFDHDLQEGKESLLFSLCLHLIVDLPNYAFDMVFADLKSLVVVQDQVEEEVEMISIQRHHFEYDLQEEKETLLFFLCLHLNVDPPNYAFDMVITLECGTLQGIQKKAVLVPLSLWMEPSLSNQMILDMFLFQDDVLTYFQVQALKEQLAEVVELFLLHLCVLMILMCYFYGLQDYG